MRIQSLLQKIFIKSHLNLDKRLHRVVLEAAETLSRCKQLSIFGLGRSLKRKTSVKHNIKTIDRLFGNHQLVTGRIKFYEDCMHWIIGNNKRPFIIIDWSGLTRCGAYHFLRASVPVGGRALPILDMTFSLKNYMKQSSLELFINQLKSILPHDCKPIIITDAGFRCPWFKLMLAMKWDFVGRVRHVTRYQDATSSKWQPVKYLYSSATSKASYLFKAFLAQSNPVLSYFYIMKNNKMNRIKKNLAGKKIQCSVSKKHEMSSNEPWLIVTSLSPKDYAPHEIMNIYKKRMQIEEGFRDLKNTKNGFSLRHCRSFNVARLNTALLLSAIAMLFLWLIGLVAKNKKLHFSYQANTIKSRNVLSNFIIGWQALIKDLDKIKQHDVLAVLKAFSLPGFSYVV